MDECYNFLKSYELNHRGTGAFWTVAKDSLSRLRDQYWTNGTTSRDSKIQEAAILPNPTFAFTSSGEIEFLVHPNTHPVDGFDLASGYVRSRWTDRDGMHRDHNPAKDSSDASEVIIAKLQFFEWAESFRQAIAFADRGGNLNIRIAVAHPVAVCHALSHFRDSDPLDYVPPWKTSAFLLDGGDYEIGCAPVRFDSIDTALLVDKLGYLNVVTMTHPLLIRNNASTLRTRAFVDYVPDYVPPGITWNQGIDPTLFGLLFEMLPLGQITGFTSESNADEICAFVAAASQGGKTVPAYESMVWKWLPLQEQSPVYIQQTSLASFFLAFYTDICQPKVYAPSGDWNLPGDCQEILPFNTPGTFAAFLALIRPRIQPDHWDDALKDFLTMLREDGILHGRLTYQELMTQMSICHLVKLDIIEPRLPPTPPSSEPDSDTIQRPHLFDKWTEVPALVCITFVVPRSVTELLDNACTANPRLDPALVIQIDVGEVHQFSCILPLYAKPRLVNFQGISFIELEEDSKGPLTVSFWIPPTIVGFNNPEDMTIRLLANGNWNTDAGAKEWKNWCVYETNFANKTSILISAERPNTLRDLERKIQYFSICESQIIHPQPRKPVKTMRITVSLRDDFKIESYHYIQPDIGDPLACPVIGDLLLTPFRSVVIETKPSPTGHEVDVSIMQQPGIFKG